MYAEVIINNNVKALNRIFDYLVPKELEDEIKIGARVFVPFGNSKKLEDGFVINLKEESEFANKENVKFKEIAKIEKEKILTEDNILLRIEKVDKNRIEKIYIKLPEKPRQD